ncbi:hypothetical protein MHAE_04360 [Mycobacterium haemophilum DSM 44634]|uniref:hypothetical protein n=1 Tax=Mycobacterium haemophilum TaxID=29311 RepID=UPI0006558C07|nr:hypothetical protein [Mycobacterium haemophilum]AKN17477.1 hypothetical protein B586_14280 [Mycobacterium haemophilum DSM 44634]MCV7341600.1 hypothetical protein [Mycobacterium haemophilum DSM 44634]
MADMYEMEFQFTPGENDPDDYAGFEAFLDSITDELANQGFDTDYTAAAAELRASWTIELPDSSEASLIAALGAFQKVLSAAGCFDNARPRGHEVLGARRLALA